MNNVWLGMMNATSDVFNAGTFTDLEGALFSLMSFSNFKESELETYDRFFKKRFENQDHYFSCRMCLFCY